MVSPCSFSFSRSRLNTLPEKEGPSTFACKSKNACGRIGILSIPFITKTHNSRQIELKQTSTPRDSSLTHKLCQPDYLDWLLVTIARIARNKEKM